jgi:hypothetical protein
MAASIHPVVGYTHPTQNVIASVNAVVSSAEKRFNRLR